MTSLDLMCFGHALDHLKEGAAVTRKNWYGSDASPVVKLQRPDSGSANTEPYLYMEKTSTTGNRLRFPIPLSCESLLAEDWMLVK